MNTFIWLLKREYWEHRGGFLWAPVWTAGIFLFLMMSILLVAEVLGARFSEHIRIGMPIQSISIQQLIANTSPEALRQVSLAMEASFVAFAGIIQVVLIFVLFFYLLGALYDDRRDRSVLFWKSLPISDAQTVLSKVATAAIVAPMIAFTVTIALHLGFLMLLSLFVLAHGVNPLMPLWNPMPLLSLWTKLLVMISLTALWALPCYGWLLLCSSFARKKPALWVIMPPVVFGWFLALSNITNGSIPHTWYWNHICGRIILGIFPGSWSMQGLNTSMDFVHEGPLALLHWATFGNVLLSSELWLGAVAGLALLLAAIHFRRFRTETSS